MTFFKLDVIFFLIKFLGTKIHTFNLIENKKVITLIIKAFSSLKAEGKIWPITNKRLGTSALAILKIAFGNQT